MNDRTASELEIVHQNPSRKGTPAAMTQSTPAPSDGPVRPDEPATNEASNSQGTASPLETRLAALEDELESLRRTQQRLRDVLDRQEALICRFRPDRTITLVNRAFCDFFGRSAETWIGQPLDLGAPSEDLRFLDQHLATLDDSTPAASFEHRVGGGPGHPSETTRWLSWVHVPIRDGNGEVTEFQGIGHEVTGERRGTATPGSTEEAVAGGDLHHLGEYASHVAHDFNNLLVGILGNSRLALMDLSPFSPCRPLVQEVESAALRAAELANQMLAKTGHFASGPRPVSDSVAVGPSWKTEGNVLVVDDEEMVRTLAKRVLAKVGFGVIAAEDGRRALDVFRAHSREITAVLLDMTMPGLDGEQTFHELRRIRPDIKVLLSSGYDAQEAVARLSRDGLAGFIHKPYLPEDLIQTLRAVIEADGPAAPTP